MQKKNMKIPTNQLIDQLLQATEKSSAAVRAFSQLDARTLNFKMHPDSWSMLECIEHLNLYGDFYLPEIERQLLKAKRAEMVHDFKPGLIGNYFANLMKVNNGKMKKMQSPKDKNPSNSKLSITSIDRFLKQQELLKSLLMEGRNCDLMKIKTGISLTKLIRLQLGDTFRFFVYHIERHVYQAEQVLQLYKQEHKTVVAPLHASANP